jgi:formylglycine-generating enzyme required for sulfatase activity
MTTTTYNQPGQNVKNQVNVGGDAKIGHVGDILNINLPPQFEIILRELLNKKAVEDLRVEKLITKAGEPETVFIPSGTFWMGSEPGDGIPTYETPSFQIDLPDYRIGKFPVTNREFEHFLRETKQAAWPELAWGNGNTPTKKELDLPVKGVTWYGALAYCYWLIEYTGRPYSLPSEAQWEKAARGPKGNVFPWGNEWQGGRLCNTDAEKVTPVDCYPVESASYYQCFDMVGNVREWTTSLWGRNRTHNLNLRNPYPLNEDRKPISEIKENQQFRRITRGGASLLSEIPLRAARRQSELPYYCGITNNRVGFRVAMNIGGTL